MKAVILAGGYGTRLSEETSVRPKPMVEIGGMPIIWHIMKTYTRHGVTDFIVCLGYKGYYIKEFFSNYFLHRSDISFDVRNNSMKVLQNGAEPWNVTLIDTGLKTMTGGRIKRVREHIGDETFCLTYGDGLSDIDMGKEYAFHKESGKLATLTAVQPPGRFGAFHLEKDQTTVRSFREKPQGDGAWINGGYFILEPEAIDFIDDDSTVWEADPLNRLARDNQLNAWKHKGFWHPMDTLRDRNHLEKLWNSGEASWKVW